MRAPTDDGRADAQVNTVASLAEPIRRTLYRFVSAQPEPVSREQVAAGAGVPHHVAKFHLDRLEDDGLLEVEFRRPGGRTGPGAGRPAKYYRRADREFAISVPPRRYELAGRLMAEAITRSETTGVSVSAALQESAHATGQQLGEQVRRAVGRRPSRAKIEHAVCEVLEDNGYEPRVEPGCITMANCPFHRLAQQYTDLLCGMNLGLIEGLVDGVAQPGLRAQLDPRSDRCCVTIDRL